ncbi:MAG: nitroreductase [Alphaproteobacteria bacterium]|nr:nitroreductase [Alphaproteobacteria bacterium]
MNVTAAIKARTSVRAFKDTPVSEALVKEILEIARFSPSGGNLQPWHVYAIAGTPLREFKAMIAARMATNPMGEGAELEIYPKDLKEPYRTRRYTVGEGLYATLGIPREDKLSRLGQMAKNFDFFGAPVALFFAIDRQMGLNQWAHLGMFMQSIMLLAQERGLATCAQEAWALWNGPIRTFLQIPDELRLYCGMALGHADDAAKVNTFRAERAPLEEFAVLKGF